MLSENGSRNQFTIKHGHVKTKDITSTTDKAYMDLTTRLPYCVSRGNEYVMVACHFDSNTIIGKAVPNRRAATLTKAWMYQQELRVHHQIYGFWTMKPLKNSKQQ